MAARKLKLTDARATYASQRKATVFKGSALAYNAGHAAKYHAKITALVLAMRKATIKAVAALYKSDAAAGHFATDANVGSQARITLNDLDKRFAALFAAQAKEIAPIMVAKANALSATNVAASLKQLSGGSEIAVSSINPVMQGIIRAAIAENVQLINSIAKDYLHEVGQQVYRSIASGKGLADLLPELERRGDVAASRAKLIAYDQTRKVYGALNKERAKSAGVTQYEWIHSSGGMHPRELHMEYDGRVFSFDDPPVIDKKTGERGTPGQAINCRCTMRPIISFGENNDS